jgi:hypothetical protein
VLATITLHTALKLPERKLAHDLGKDGAAGVHAPGCHERPSPFKSFPPKNSGTQQNLNDLSATSRSTLGQ